MFIFILSSKPPAFHLVAFYQAKRLCGGRLGWLYIASKCLLELNATLNSSYLQAYNGTLIV